jgi:hypothetical protein
MTSIVIESRIEDILFSKNSKPIDPIDSLIDKMNNSSISNAYSVKIGRNVNFTLVAFTIEATDKYIYIKNDEGSVLRGKVILGEDLYSIIETPRKIFLHNYITIDYNKYHISLTI